MRAMRSVPSGNECCAEPDNSWRCGCPRVILSAVSESALLDPTRVSAILADLGPHIALERLKQELVRTGHSTPGRFDRDVSVGPSNAPLSGDDAESPADTADIELALFRVTTVHLKPLGIEWRKVAEPLQLADDEVELQERGLQQPPDPTRFDDVPSWFHRWRAGLGVPVHELAFLSGISREMLHRFNNGTHQPTEQDLRALQDAAGFDDTYLEQLDALRAFFTRPATAADHELMAKCGTAEALLEALTSALADADQDRIRSVPYATDPADPTAIALFRARNQFRPALPWGDINDKYWDTQRTAPAMQRLALRHPPDPELFDHQAAMLRFWRTGAGMQADELGARWGMSKGRVSKLERGAGRASPQSWQEVGRRCDIPADQVLALISLGAPQHDSRLVAADTQLQHPPPLTDYPSFPAWWVAWSGRTRLTNAEMADRLGIPAGTLQAYRLGRRRPSDGRIAAIGNRLGWPAELVAAVQEKAADFGPRSSARARALLARFNTPQALRNHLLTMLGDNAETMLIAADGHERLTTHLWRLAQLVPDAPQWSDIVARYHLSLSRAAALDVALRVPPYPAVFDSFAAWLRQYRAGLGSTRTALAARLGVPVPVLIEYENGTRIPSIVDIRRLCATVHFRDAALLGLANLVGDYPTIPESWQPTKAATARDYLLTMVSDVASRTAETIDVIYRQLGIHRPAEADDHAVELALFRARNRFFRSEIAWEEIATHFNVTRTMTDLPAQSLDQTLRPADFSSPLVWAQATFAGCGLTQREVADHWRVSTHDVRRFIAGRYPTLPAEVWSRNAAAARDQAIQVALRQPPNPALFAALADWWRAWRANTGLTYRELAVHLSIPEMTLWAYVHGRREISYQRIMALASALGWSAETAAAAAAKASGNRSPRPARTSLPSGDSDPDRLTVRSTTFASWIADYRKSIGFTQPEFAKALEMSLTALKEYERGGTVPKVVTIRHICQNLTLPATVLLGLAKLTGGFPTVPPHWFPDQAADVRSYLANVVTYTSTKLGIAKDVVYRQLGVSNVQHADAETIKLALFRAHQRFLRDEIAWSELAVTFGYPEDIAQLGIHSLTTHLDIAAFPTFAAWARTTLDSSGLTQKELARHYDVTPKRIALAQRRYPELLSIWTFHGVAEPKKYLATITAFIARKACTSSRTIYRQLGVANVQHADAETIELALFRAHHRYLRADTTWSKIAGRFGYRTDPHPLAIKSLTTPLDKKDFASPQEWARATFDGTGLTRRQLAQHCNVSEEALRRARYRTPLRLAIWLVHSSQTAQEYLDTAVHYQAQQLEIPAAAVYRQLGVYQTPADDETVELALFRAYQRFLSTEITWGQLAEAFGFDHDTQQLAARSLTILDTADFPTLTAWADASVVKTVGNHHRWLGPLIRRVVRTLKAPDEPDSTVKLNTALNRLASVLPADVRRTLIPLTAAPARHPPPLPAVGNPDAARNAFRRLVSTQLKPRVAGYQIGLPPHSDFYRSPRHYVPTAVELFRAQQLYGQYADQDRAWDAVAARSGIAEADEAAMRAIALSYPPDPANYRTIAELRDWYRKGCGISIGDWRYHKTGLTPRRGETDPPLRRLLAFAHRFTVPDAWLRDAVRCFVRHTDIPTDLWFPARFHSPGEYLRRIAEHSGKPLDEFATAIGVTDYDTFADDPAAYWPQATEMFIANNLYLQQEMPDEHLMAAFGWRRSTSSLREEVLAHPPDPKKFSTFADWLRSYRAKAGLAQKRLATMAGVALNAVHGWERHMIPELVQLKRLRDALGFPTEVLIELVRFGPKGKWEDPLPPNRDLLPLLEAPAYSAEEHEIRNQLVERLLAIIDRELQIAVVRSDPDYEDYLQQARLVLVKEIARTRLLFGGTHAIVAMYVQYALRAHHAFLRGLPIPWGVRRALRPVRSTREHFSRINGRPPTGKELVARLEKRLARHGVKAWHIKQANTVIRLREDVGKHDSFRADAHIADEAGAEVLSQLALPEDIAFSQENVELAVALRQTLHAVPFGYDIVVRSVIYGEPLADVAASLGLHDSAAAEKRKNSLTLLQRLSTRTELFAPDDLLAGATATPGGANVRRRQSAPRQ